MTFKEDILKFITRFPNVRPRTIINTLNINPSTIYSAISNLRKEGILTKPRKNFTVEVKGRLEPKIFYRKIVKTGASERRTGKRIRIWALTYEANKIDRFDFLVDKLREKFPQAEGITEFGYDDNKTIKDPPFVFDNWLAGQE